MIITAGYAGFDQIYNDRIAKMIGCKNMDCTNCEDMCDACGKQVQISGMIYLRPMIGDYMCDVMDGDRARLVVPNDRVERMCK